MDLRNGVYLPPPSSLLNPAHPIGELHPSKRAPIQSLSHSDSLHILTYISVSDTRREAERAVRVDVCTLPESPSIHQP